MQQIQCIPTPVLWQAVAGVVPPGGDTLATEAGDTLITEDGQEILIEE